MFIFHVGVECGMRSIGFSTTLSTYKVFGNVLVFTSVYFLHLCTKYYGVIRTYPFSKEKLNLIYIFVLIDFTK